MRQLWKALLERITYWLTPKPPVPVIVQAPAPPLKPGMCECGHKRCSHLNGTGTCVVAMKGPREDSEYTCACTVFILVKDDDDDGEVEPKTPSPAELERWYQK